MASGTTRLSDLIVPEIYVPIKQILTEEKSAILASGALVRDQSLDALLAGEGLTFNVPFFKDLDNDTENVSSDDPSSHSSPNKIGTGRELGVRLSRNNSWSSMDLNASLISKDPLNAIAARVAAYWTRRLQAAFVATMKGVFADNAAAPDAGDTHTQNDMTVDISGVSYTEGVTDFSAEAFIDASTTMGDSMEDLSLVLMHSVVYARALKNNLIDFVAESANGNAIQIPTFLGRRVVKDDGMPASGGVYETWLFGAGAVRLGVGAAKVPVETDRDPTAGTGGGQETLYDRVEWMVHPNGHRYIGTAPNGGPSNAATSNNLAAATSWQRTFPERKQIKIARLITREA
jgi:hypothetical protein